MRSLAVTCLDYFCIVFPFLKEPSFDSSVGLIRVCFLTWSMYCSFEKLRTLSYPKNPFIHDCGSGLHSGYIIFNAIIPLNMTFFILGTTSPVPCPLGTLSNSTGLGSEDECQPCPGGFYCANTALSVPTGLCSEGYVQYQLY